GLARLFGLAGFGVEVDLLGDEGVLLLPRAGPLLRLDARPRLHADVAVGRRRGALGPARAGAGRVGDHLGVAGGRLVARHDPRPAVDLVGLRLPLPGGTGAVGAGRFLLDLRTAVEFDLEVQPGPVGDQADVAIAGRGRRGFHARSRLRR